MRKEQALRTYFGYDGFRPGQAELIDALLGGSDVLGVMPTGAGKSVCYQIPALLLKGTALVISPLISLMNDQVGALLQAGIPAACLHSGLPAAAAQDALTGAREGRWKLLYIAPERLQTPEMQSLCARLPISLVAVDEAHCVSQWGQDFRPSYLRISAFLGGLPSRPPVGAFTATATAAVREDIVSLLSLRGPYTRVGSFDRANLRFEVRMPAARKRTDALIECLDGMRGQSGIVYCATRKAVEEVREALVAAGIAATRYHAGLGDAERAANQDAFARDEQPVMVATNAFGMGIDKSNVGFVVHYQMPKDMESYYQEAGRAGRDGSAARCVLLFSRADIATNRFLIDRERGEDMDPETAARVKRAAGERLSAMVNYCYEPGCLRAYILGYFGEQTAGPCGNCGGCNGDAAETDVTRQAQMALSCVARMDGRFGQAFIARVLLGSEDKRITQAGLERLSTYGLLRDWPREQVQALLTHLCAKGYLAVGDGPYPTLSLTPAARAVLQGNERVALRLMQAPPERRDGNKPLKGGKFARRPGAAAADDELLARLKALRGRLAKAQGQPAYIVFTDAALQDMCQRRPRTPQQFLQVSGVGQAKAARYGAAFLTEICGEAVPPPSGDSGAPWTPAEEEWLRREQEERLPLTTMARLHRRPEAEVAERLRRMGLA